MEGLKKKLLTASFQTLCSVLDKNLKSTETKMQFRFISIQGHCTGACGLAHRAREVKKSLSPYSAQPYTTVNLKFRLPSEQGLK